MSSCASFSRRRPSRGRRPAVRPAKPAPPPAHSSACRTRTTSSTRCPSSTRCCGGSAIAWRCCARGATRSPRVTGAAPLRGPARRSNCSTASPSRTSTCSSRPSSCTCRFPTPARRRTPARWRRALPTWWGARSVPRVPPHACCARCSLKGKATASMRRACGTRSPWRCAPWPKAPGTTRRCRACSMRPTRPRWTPSAASRPACTPWAGARWRGRGGTATRWCSSPARRTSSTTPCSTPASTSWWPPMERCRCRWTASRRRTTLPGCGVCTGPPPASRCAPLRPARPRATSTRCCSAPTAAGRTR